MTPFEILFRAMPAFSRGIATTLELWIFSCAIGTFFGVILGWLLYVGRHRNNLVRTALTLVPESLKSIPALVLLVWFHYLVPGYLGFIPTPMFTSVLVFSIIVTIGVGELVRSSIVGIPIGELEAGAAIGLTSREVARLIALPLAFRAASPGLILLFIDTLKLSTLASAIALDEMLHVTDTVIAKSYVALPAYSALALIFMVVVMPLNFAAQRYSARLGISR
jgi:polar amino acid transport system permease protein